MQFQVPQFIDIEDKIFGPFSFKQFLYLLGGGGLSFVVYKFLPIYLSIPVILPIAGLSIALTFSKPNGRPFIYRLESWFYFLFTRKLYVWKKSPPKTTAERAAEAIPVVPAYVPKLSSSRLHDLSWSLNVLDANKKSNQGS